MIAEREIHAKDEFRRLLDALPTGLVHARGDIVAYCNETFAEMVGETPGELIGRPLFDLIAPDHLERARLRRDERQRGLPVPDQWECDLVRRDGKRIRVEFEPRAIGDGEHLVLVRDLGTALHDIELANSLSNLALRLQRERSVDAVLRTAALGLEELGMFMDALRIEGEDAVVHTVSRPAFAAAFEAAVGSPMVGARFPLEGNAAVRQVIDDRRALYLDETQPFLEQLIGPEHARSLADVAGKKAVLAPLFVGARAWGFIVIGARALTSRDAATLSLFSAQVASAMEVACTIDELDRANRGLQAIQVDNERLHSETRRRLDLLSVQYGLSRAIAGSLEEEPLAEHALGLLIEKLGADGGWIYVQREGQLRLVGSRLGGGADARDKIEGQLALDGGSVCAMCASQRAPIVADLAANPEIRSPAARALGMRHIAALPLVLEDRLVGTLTVARTSADGFRDEELQLIESSAVQLAVALERSRLFVAERRRAHDLSRLNELGAIISQHLELPALLSLGVEHVMRLVDVPQVFLSLLEPGGTSLRVVASNLREPGVLDISIDRGGAAASAAAVRELRPVLIEDAMNDLRAARAQAIRFGQKSVLAVPLISRGEPIGALVLAETRAGRSFCEATVGRAVAVANQLAGAIANARLFEEERDRVRELSLLSELGRIASGTLQREVLLSESLGHISSSLRFESGAAWVVQRGGRLERAATHSTSADGQADAAEMEELAQRAIAAAAPVCTTAPGDVHACALPLLAGTEVGGVLAFARRSRPVLDAELRTLAAAAPELGVALQNARLFDDARLRVEQLRLLLDIGRAITGSLDLDSILETSAGILNRFIDGSNAFILLLGPNDQLRGAACSNPAWRDSFRSTRIALDDPHSIAAASVRDRKAVAISDVNRSSYAGSTRVALYDEQSVLALPLLVRDEPIGCVLVDDTRSPRTWSPEEIERATLIVHQVAVAVANARLYDDLKRSYGELARTQEELVKRERLAALGELSAVVAHEVRNPLGVIFNSLGSMRRLLKPTGDGAMLLDIVEEEADRLDRIVRDLLDFARPNEPALETERLDDILADTLQAVEGDARPPGVDVDVQLPDDLPCLRIDARMIRQVLLNLVLNGMQAMPRGGTLRIRAAHEPKTGRLVRIDFTDEGTGVPQELAARIFQPFFTTKAAGTGLGLAVVKRFVDAHRGRIDFQSRAGEGTTFTLFLPVDEAVR